MGPSNISSAGSFGFGATPQATQPFSFANAPLSNAPATTSVAGASFGFGGFNATGNS